MFSAQHSGSMVHHPLCLPPPPLSSCITFSSSKKNIPYPLDIHSPFRIVSVAVSSCVPTISSAVSNLPGVPARAVSISGIVCPSLGAQPDRCKYAPCRCFSNIRKYNSGSRANALACGFWRVHWFWVCFGRRHFLLVLGLAWLVISAALYTWRHLDWVPDVKSSLLRAPYLCVPRSLF